MAKRTYTAAEKAKYWADKAAEGGETTTKKKRRTSTPKGRKRKPKAEGEPAKRSGCKYEESYKSGDELVNRPRITAWRIDKNGNFHSMTAYLGKDNGAPQNGTSADVCLIFVVNITIKGMGEMKPVTGVWSRKYRKLSITSLDLVANPFAANGGYFGRGGKRYKDKVK